MEKDEKDQYNKTKKNNFNYKMSSRNLDNQIDDKEKSV